MGRNADRDVRPGNPKPGHLSPGDFGFRREPVHGTTHDSGGPFRERMSGRNYPGSRARRDAPYARGPYAPSGYEPADYDWRHDAYEREHGGAYAENYSENYDENRIYGDDTYRNARSAPYTEPWAVPGPHAGRGPEGWRRPEDTIREDVCERLTHHGYVDASDVTVRVEGDEVILEGTVASRDDKRVAEDAAAGVAGVWDVQNRLRVRR